MALYLSGGKWETTRSDESGIEGPSPDRPELIWSYCATALESNKDKHSETLDLVSSKPQRRALHRYFSWMIAHRKVYLLHKTSLLRLF